MSDLEDFINSKMSFLKLDDGESFTGIYKGSVKVPKNRFGNFAICYKLQPIGSEKVLDWETGSLKVAMQIHKFKEGDCIKITRRGLDKQTTYKVEASTPF